MVAYGSGIGAVVGFILLILDIIAIVEVLQSTRTMGGKLGWILLVFFFPIVGLILYCLLARREHHTHHYVQV